MHRYLLHRDAFFCVLDGSAVFLNVRRCEYLAVSLAQLRRIPLSAAGWPEAAGSADDRLSDDSGPTSPPIDDLVRRGILTTSPRDGRSVEPVRLATRRAPPSIAHSASAEPLRMAELSSFLRAVARATFRLRRRDLLYLIRQIEAAKAIGHRATDTRCGADIEHATRKFERLRVWCYSAQGACLRDSLVLADFLLRRGFTPTFVIGVRSKPFAAHAWVQCGDTVLNDTVENVQRYIPILAI